MIEIKHRLTGAVLRTVDAENLRSADLRSADLRSADLSGADLSGANLSGANLSGANLRSANLRNADLSGADLRNAYLRNANLSGANLSGADLSGANLSGANLRSADLSGADLSGADLSGADLSGANLSGALGLARYVICAEGAIRGYKKCLGGAVVTLEIPRGAARVNAYGSRKCRAEYAVVVDAPASGAMSQHDSSFEYRVGATVRPREAFDPDPRVECASGIHFFITRAEAEEY